MPRKKTTGNGTSNIHIIGENHKMAIRTIASITKILMDVKSTDKVAIVAELGMCKSYGVLDKRIVSCDEEPECMNLINCVVSMIATLCLYDKDDNRALFNDMYPHYVRLEWIPQLTGNVDIEADRKKAVATLTTHVLKMLRDCLSPSLFEDFKGFLLAGLQECNDMAMAMNVSNAIRDRWLAQRAKELAKRTDVVIVVAGLAHVPRLIGLLRPLPDGNVWA